MTVICLENLSPLIALPNFGLLQEFLTPKNRTAFRFQQKFGFWNCGYQQNGMKLFLLKLPSLFASLAFLGLFREVLQEQHSVFPSNLEG